MKRAAVACVALAVASCAPPTSLPASRPTEAATPTASPKAAPTATVTGTATASPIANLDAGDDGWQVIVDLSAQVPAPVIVEQERVLTLVVGPHVSSAARCADAGASSTLATLSGAFAGAYTAKGAKEKAYVVNTRPCGGGMETHRFVVLADMKIKVRAPVPEDALYSVHDLDGDGDNEILLLGTNANGGTTAHLYSAEDAQLQELVDFGEVGRGSCEWARILVRVRGTSMEFHADKERLSQCR